MFIALILFSNVKWLLITKVAQYASSLQWNFNLELAAMQGNYFLSDLTWSTYMAWETTGSDKHGVVNWLKLQIALSGIDCEGRKRGPFKGERLQIHRKLERRKQSHVRPTLLGNLDSKKI